MTALNSVSLQLIPGIHAVLGENGAGKTTLLRVLAGETLPDSGSVEIGGEIICRFHPTVAKKNGVRIVRQKSTLIPSMTIPENFLLEDYAVGTWRSLPQITKAIKDSARQFRVSLPMNVNVGAMSASQRQWAEFFRGVFFGGRVLILDEPTSLLPPVEAGILLDQCRELAETSATTVVFVTHKVSELVGFADRATVLRRGSVVYDGEVKGMSDGKLAELMVGKEVNPNRRSEITQPLRTIARLNNVNAFDSSGRRVLDKVSLDIESGVVLGVAGVCGGGQSQLAELIAGIGRSEPTLVCRYIPADRLGSGAASTLAVSDNLLLRVFSQSPFSRRCILNRTAMSQHAMRLAERFDVRVTSLNQSLNTLSGGNVQKIIVARELDGNVDILVAHNPTAGLDVATAAQVRNELVKSARRGTAVVLISDDLDEILTTCDKVAVLFSGGIKEIISCESGSRALISEAMTGAQSPTVVGVTV